MAEQIKISERKAGDKLKPPPPVHGLNKSSVPGMNSSYIDRVLHLQRTVGNREVTRLIRSGVIRTKLTIGQPGDIYEQEADRIADRVMRMPGEKQSLVSGHSSLVNGHLSSVQRQSTRPGCEEEEKPISRKASGSCGASPDIMSCVESHINDLKGGGQSLSPAAREFFEPRFGSDFSQVRVHTGSDAGAIATEINARAFTTGNDIFFNTGQYSPGTSGGKNLLAHELTHVIQQNGMIQERIQRRELRGEDFPWDGVVANTTFVWFRSAAKLDDTNKIQILAKGTGVKITGKSGNWLAAEYGGKNGYIYKDYIIHKFEADAQKDISGVCDQEPCRKKSGCAINECKNEAAIIAEKYVSRVNQIRKPGIPNVSDQHWGWLCYEWAGLLTREFIKLKLKCWKINWVGIIGSTNSLEHNYIYVSLEDITPSGVEAPKRGCGMILDAWRTGNPLVYDVSWSWHKWNYIHNPTTDAGKAYTGGTWHDVKYNPPWTPAEPAPSPTIKTP